MPVLYAKSCLLAHSATLATETCQYIGWNIQHIGPVSFLGSRIQAIAFMYSICLDFRGGGWPLWHKVNLARIPMSPTRVVFLIRLDRGSNTVCLSNVSFSACQRRPTSHFRRLLSPGYRKL